MLLNDLKRKRYVNNYFQYVIFWFQESELVHALIWYRFAKFFTNREK